MGLIRRVDLGEVVNSAVPLDLEDLRLRAEAIKRHAVEEAERIVGEARAERERLIAGASERGHAEGLAKGLTEGRERGLEEGRAEALARGREELAALGEAWRAALERFEADRGEMLRRAREDVVRLAVRMGEKVTKRTVETDPGVVAAQLAEVLALHARPTGLTVLVNPEDLGVAREAMASVGEAFGGAEHATLAADPSLSRGSCVARTDGAGVIDATIEGQLDRVVEALVPAGEGGPRGAAAPDADQGGAFGDAA